MDQSEARGWPCYDVGFNAGSKELEPHLLASLSCLLPVQPQLEDTPCAPASSKVVHMSINK